MHRPARPHLDSRTVTAQAQAAKPAGGHRSRRRLALLALLAVLLTALAVTWVGLRAQQARAAAQQASTAAERTRAAVLGGATDAARLALADTQQHARRAHDLVSDPLWRVTTHLPLIGDDAQATRTVLTALDDLAAQVLPPLVAAGADVRAGSLRVRDGRVDLAPVVRARDRIVAADAAASRVAATLAPLRPDALLGPVGSNVAAAQHAVSDLAATIHRARTTAELLPPMLGADGRRRYFLAFQNNAEARGTGGLLGAYGILDADRGRLRLVHLGPNTELRSPRRMPIDLGANFRGLYNHDPALWANANLSPHFPYAAQIWLALWQRQTGERLDGVIATDPKALSYVLRATGPVTLPDRTRVGADNAVELTLRDVYGRFPRRGQNRRRDAYLQTIAAAVFERVLRGGVDARALADAMSKAAGERRLLVYSTRASEQQRLAASEVGGIVADAPGPFAAVVINNAAGGKLDYYLQRRLTYTSTTCTAAERHSKINVALTNTAPAAGLPDYVTLRADRGDLTDAPADAPPGTNVSHVQVYAAHGAQLLGATLDGERLLVGAGVERGHAVFLFTLTLRPGQTRSVDLELREPGGHDVSSGGFVQPLVKSATTRADVSSCRD